MMKAIAWLNSTSLVADPSTITWCSLEESASVVMCAQCEVHWYVDAEPARCTASEHDHQRFDLHVHRTVVVLPGGTEVIAVSFDVPDPYARDLVPDFGLYLDPQWAPPWPHAHL